MTLAWIAVALGAGWVAFAFVGYPLLLLLLRHRSPRPVARADIAPSVSVVIAVHDGAEELGPKLENVLASDYPGPLEVIVSSDGSTDATEAVAEAFAERGVRLVAHPERRGKESAQAAGIGIARGEVLVFTDVAARLEPGTLRALVQPLADPGVGCVSSEDVVEDRSGEGLYVRFEMALRRLESEAATLAGLSGSLFAARRELCTPWPPDLASDFRTALEAARQGLRAVSAPAARAHFGVTDEAAAEWRRKVRTVQRGIAVLSRYTDLLHPRHGRAALVVWGHKAARFTTPLGLALLLAGSLAAATGSGLAAVLSGAQLLAYVGGGLALVWPPLARVRLARLASFFLLVNASMLVAWSRHLRGERAVTWQPTRR